MELNHKFWKIYGEGNKSVKIKDAKETLVLRNGESNGVTLNDVFKKIDDFETNKIWGWSIFQFYKVENGYLVDNEGNQISLKQGEEVIYFKSIEDPVFEGKEKEVNLDYIKDVSILLGLNTIEETITGLSNEDKQILVEERMTANEKRQKEIRAEKEEADAREKKLLEEEQKRIEKEQIEEKERLDKLEAESLLEQAEAKKKQDEEEENKRIELENKQKQEEEEKQIQEEEENKKKAELKRKKERMENENVYSPSQYRDLRKSYLKNGFAEYISNDGKYIFFFTEIEEGETMSDEEKPFVVLKTNEDYEELIGGELTINNEKTAEYEFKHEGEDKVVTLNKKTDSIKVQVLA